MTQPAPIPLTRPQPVDAIAPTGVTCVVEATEAERLALARFIEILAVHELSANLRAEREGTRVHVTGTVKARVSQACVVTLDPVTDKLSIPLAIDFVPQALLPPPIPASSDDDPDAPEARMAEPIVKGVMDLGEVVFQELAAMLLAEGAGELLQHGIPPA